MYNSDLASDIEKAVQDALATSDFSKLNQNITTAVNTSIAQIGTNQNRFYQQYDGKETTAEELEHIDGEIVNGDLRADYKARRQAAQAEAERARYNSRQAAEARRQAAEARRRQEAEENRRQAAQERQRENERRRAQAADRQQNRSRYDYSGRLREAAEAFGFFGGSAARKGEHAGGGNAAYNARPGANGSYTRPGSAAFAHRGGNSTELVPISRNPKGRVSGTLFSVFGWIGLALSVMMFIAFNFAVNIGEMPYRAYDTLMGALFAPTLVISGAMTIVGTKRRHRIHRFYQYVRQLRGRAYCPVKELSSHIGRSERFVLKDVRKMISLGMFPEGHIDDQQTCVMLNGTTYDQYLKAQNAYLARQLEEKRTNARIHTAAEHFAAQADADGTTFHGSQPPNRSVSGASGPADASGSAAPQAAGNAAAGAAAANRSRATLPPKVIQVLSAGDSYLTKIREANAAIPGEIISAKLDRLEEIIQKIYARIELHPEQVEDLDKFINYYLPTTLKLVDAYRDFNAQSVQGDNIKTAKQEIESTLETIIYAFETLLDSLYEDDALDISTDISVLQTMFAQEGLTKGAFDKAE